MWQWVVTLVASYVLGSIPMGLIIVKLMRGVDVRQVGSGRTGGTNVLRAAGFGAAALTVLLDGGKAILAVFIARWLSGAPLLMALAGTAAVVGHNYSLFLRLRGGAGTATSVGGAAALWPWNAAILIPVGLGVVFGTRRASLGSITIAILLPLIFVVRAAMGLSPWAFVVHGVLTSALTLWALRPTLGRLLRGEERRIKL